MTTPTRPDLPEICDDPIMQSVRDDAEFYRKNPRSLSSWGHDYGSDKPQGVEEQYQAAAREKRMRESGVPE